MVAAKSADTASSVSEVLLQARCLSHSVRRALAATRPRSRVARARLARSHRDGDGRPRTCVEPQVRPGSDPRPRLRARARSGRWLALYASLTQPVDARPSEMVIVIETAKPE